MSDPSISPPEDGGVTASVGSTATSRGRGRARHIDVGTSNVSPTSGAVGTPVGRGRGYCVDSSPLRKPNLESPRNSSRPGSATQSPRSVQTQNAASSTYPHKSDTIPKTTISDSSVSSSMKSPLDVTAAEFVPKLVKSLPALSVSASEFVPLAYQQPQPVNEYELLIQYLEMVLQELLDFPDRYELSIPNIASTLQASLNDEISMFTACDVIFEWAISQSNFSYTCARICQYVSQKVPNKHNGQFHQHMLKRCRSENEQFSELLSKDANRACHFVVFLAELFTKDVGRVRPVMNAVLENMNLMVAQIDNNLAKTVGQVMKMCGACLEDDLNKAGLLDKMNTLISSLRAKASCGELNQSMSRMLLSVVTLREDNWGRSSAPPSPTNSVPPSPRTEFNQEPVFFNTSGQRITREEAGYGMNEDEPSSAPVQWSTNDGQNVWSGNDNSVSAGAAGDHSETDDFYNPDDGDLDILVVDDDDEQMTEDMWAEYERFEAERDQNLTNYQNEYEKH